MATRTRDEISLILSSPTPPQTSRIYERRRETLRLALGLLMKREEEHHLAATCNEDLTAKVPAWSQTANLGAAISHVGLALAALGMKPEEVDRWLADRRRP